MRPLLALLFLTAGVLVAQANVPDTTFPSPDTTWLITAHWINGGYDWNMRNAKTGKVYLQQPVGKDDFLPRRFRALWNSTSRYAALEIYYGRITQDMSLIAIINQEPNEISWPWDAKPSVNLADWLLHKEDRKSYDASAPPLIYDAIWLNETDIQFTVDDVYYLNGSNDKSKLQVEGRLTVHLDGKSTKIIDYQESSYDKLGPDQEPTPGPVE